jgi:hypothetical protein
VAIVLDSVAAAAPVAAPCDLTDISFPYCIENRRSLYLAYLFYAYGLVYGHSIATVLAAPYTELVPELFDGEHDEDEILAPLAQMLDAYRYRFSRRTE